MQLRSGETRRLRERFDRAADADDLVTRLRASAIGRETAAFTLPAVARVLEPTRPRCRCWVTLSVTASACRVGMSAVPTLERAVYGVGQASALLGMRQDKVRGWLDGYERRA